MADSLIYEDESEPTVKIVTCPPGIVNHELSNPTITPIAALTQARDHVMAHSVLLALMALVPTAEPPAPETIWLEAEHLDGIRGYCWPMANKPELKKTDGHWGLSGPGWAAEWNQGGESGFLSIACGADDDKAVATKSIEIPAAGRYFIWVRYGDWREQSERFQIRIEQDAAQPWEGKFGERAMVEEDNEMKLYWGWAFAWDKREAN